MKKISKMIANVNTNWSITCHTEKSSCPLFFINIVLWEYKLREISRYEGEGKALLFHLKSIWSDRQNWLSWLCINMWKKVKKKVFKLTLETLLLPTLPLISKVKLKSSFSPSSFNLTLYKMKKTRGLLKYILLLHFWLKWLCKSHCKKCQWGAGYTVVLGLAS